MYSSQWSIWVWVTITASKSLMISSTVIGRSTIGRRVFFCSGSGVNSYPGYYPFGVKNGSTRIFRPE